MQSPQAGRSETGLYAICRMWGQIPGPTISIRQYVAQKLSGGCASRASHVEAKQDDVAILDDVVAAFLAHRASVLGAALAAKGDEVGA